MSIAANAVVVKIADWIAGRHGPEAGDVTLDRRRVYILPTAPGACVRRRHADSADRLDQLHVAARLSADLSGGQHGGRRHAQHAFESRADRPAWRAGRAGLRRRRGRVRNQRDQSDDRRSLCVAVFVCDSRRSPASSFSRFFSRGAARARAADNHDRATGARFAHGRSAFAGTDSGSACLRLASRSRHAIRSGSGAPGRISRPR